MEKKKILMVHNFYQIGGGEHTVFHNEVELLRENGHEVIEYTRSNDELKTSKIKLLLMPFTTIWSWKTYREVRRIIKREKIEVVHCHNTFPLISPSVYYAARSLKIPVVQTIHNFRFLCPGGTFFCGGKTCEKCNEEWRFKSALTNKCYRDSKIQTFVLTSMLNFHRAIGTYKKISYIFLTEFNRSKFAKLIKTDSDQVFVKPNFVKQKSLNRKYTGEKIFVFASRLDENKGVKQLIEYWKCLPSDYVLHIYGDGALKEWVEKIGEAVDNLFVYGFQNQDTIFEDLSSATAMVFPSILYEGFPMIVAESLSLGCPVVATNIGNHADVIKASGGGNVYDINDYNSFMKALEDVIENNYFYSQNGIKYFERFLAEDINYRMLTEIYDKARVIE